MQFDAEPVRPKAVVFDLGGVVVEWNPRLLYERVFDDPEEMEWFLDNICTSAWNAELDRGRPFAEAVGDLREAHPEYGEAIEAYHTRWEEMLGEEIRHTTSIVFELRERGVPVFALSNWSNETFPIAERRFGLSAWFDGVVISGREGVVKPEREIFELICDRFGLTPKETVFIDDSPANVRAAERLGFRAHLFESPTALRVLLSELGLI